MRSAMKVMMPMDPWTIDVAPPTERAPRAELGRMKETLSPAMLDSAATWRAEAGQSDRAPGTIQGAPAQEVVTVLGSAMKLRKRGSSRAGITRAVPLPVVHRWAGEAGPSIASVIASFVGIAATGLSR